MSLLPLKLKRGGLSYFFVIQYNEGKKDIKKKICLIVLQVLIQVIYILGSLQIITQKITYL